MTLVGRISQRRIQKGPRWNSAGGDGAWQMQPGYSNIKYLNRGKNLIIKKAEIKQKK